MARPIHPSLLTRPTSTSFALSLRKSPNNVFAMQNTAAKAITLVLLHQTDQGSSDSPPARPPPHAMIFEQAPPPPKAPDWNEKCYVIPLQLLRLSDHDLLPTSPQASEEGGRRPEGNTSRGKRGRLAVLRRYVLCKSWVASVSPRSVVTCSLRGERRPWAPLQPRQGFVPLHPRSGASRPRGTLLPRHHLRLPCW